MTPSRGDGPAFQSIIEHALVGIYIVQDNRLVYTNPRLQDLFGYTGDELAALPSVLSLVHPDDRAMVAERLRERVEGRRETSTHPMRGLRRDGSVIEVEVYSRRTMHGGRPAVTGTMVDVTERRREERANATREQRYREMVEYAADAVFTCDLQGRLTSLNRAGEELTGYPSAEICGSSLIDLVVPAQGKALQELIERQIRDRTEAKRELEIVTRTGERRIVEISSRVIQREGVAAEILGIARDMTERNRQEQALRSLTLVDDLTQLYNRRGFLTLADRHLKLAVRKKQSVFLLFADVDGLKAINDTFGHMAGDRALADTAEILRRSFRSADIIARLGGDEFTVFPIEASGASADLLIGRLNEHVEAHNNEHAERGYRLALSVGIARLEPDASWTIDQLLEQADRALYSQKRRRSG